jgi:hypothetical protein
MAKTKAERLADIHTEALRDFDNIQTAMRDERIQCLEDRRFYSIAGAQWEGPLEEQFENKPRFEVNKIALSVMRIINEYRNNRISVDFVPKDGSTDVELASTCDALYRASEQDSGADEAYDNAFEEAVGGGFGAWRLRNVYVDEEDDESDEQKIVFEPIYDADSSVFFDLDAKRQDKGDATRCFVITSMTRESYKTKYDDDPTNWPKSIHDHEFDWATPDVVYVAEYYKVEEVRETVRIFQDLAGEETRYTRADFEADESLEATLLATGSVEIGQKRVMRKKVHKYTLSGGKVLEDHGIIAGKHIPVIPVYGKRWFIDNIERCMGHVRLAKDAQRLKNMQLSKLAEISALSSIEKPIMTPEQVAGHQMMWAEDNLKDYPYLLINPVTDQNGLEQAVGPVGYTRSAAVPPAMAGLLQLTEADMRDILGNQEAGEEMQPNLSGKAVELIQNRLDMQSFIYMSNMSKAVKRCGEIWLSMARDIFVEEGRKLKGMEKDGTPDTYELMTPIIDQDTGELTYKNDLTRASFDVAVDVGPTSSSRRAATVRSVTGMLQLATDPETQAVLTSLAMMNMEGEGIGDIRQFFRKKLVRMGVVEPNEAEQEQMAMEAQNQQPDPNAMFLQASAMEAEAKAIKAQADAIKAQADTEYRIAQTAETKANTLKTLAELENDEQRLALETADRLTQTVEQAFDVATEVTQQPMMPQE